MGVELCRKSIEWNQTVEEVGYIVYIEGSISIESGKNSMICTTYIYSPHFKIHNRNDRTYIYSDKKKTCIYDICVLHTWTPYTMYNITFNGLNYSVLIKLCIGKETKGKEQTNYYYFEDCLIKER